MNDAAVERILEVLESVGSTDDEKLSADEKLHVLELARLKVVQRRGLTPGDVEARNYTYVTAACLEADGSRTGRLRFENFLVSSRSSAEAKQLARAYVDAHGWTLMETENSSYDQGPISLYPGNYIREARKLFEQGKYI